MKHQTTVKKLKISTSLILKNCKHTVIPVKPNSLHCWIEIPRYSLVYTGPVFKLMFVLIKESNANYKTEAQTWITGPELVFKNPLAI